MSVWHVLHTRAGWEKRIAILCARKKIEVFVPIMAGSARRRTQGHVLFPCYVFVSIRQEDHVNILRIEGVIGLVHWLHNPVIIPVEEIDAIRSFVRRHKDISLQPTGVGSGTRLYRSEDRLWLPSLGYVLMPAEPRPLLPKINQYEI